MGKGEGAPNITVCGNGLPLNGRRIAVHDNLCLCSTLR